MYRFEVKVASRSKGRSAVAMACYRAAEKHTDERQGIVHDYRKKRGVAASAILAPGNAPESLLKRATLWNSVEKAEKRKDSQLAREFLLSLPNTLNPQQNAALVSKWVKQHLVGIGMLADVSLHDLEGHNPHAHILTPMRSVTASGFGKKERSWNDKKLLQRLRESWADHINAAFAAVGRSDRVSHLSYSQQIRSLQAELLEPSEAIIWNKASKLTTSSRSKSPKHR